MKYLDLCFLSLALITILSCTNQENLITNSTSLACDKLTSREAAENLINQVKENRFTDSVRITGNLIGEWELIGIVPGWTGFETGQECFRLTIDADQIKLEDLNSGSISSSEWALKTFRINVYTGFYLETNEDAWNNRMGMEVFSENLMLGSGRVADGNIYIYQKLE